MSFEMNNESMVTPSRSRGACSAIRARRGNVMPINKTTTIQARVLLEDKRFLKRYAESQGITLSELLRRSTTALIHIIRAQQQQSK